MFTKENTADATHISGCMTTFYKDIIKGVYYKYLYRSGWIESRGNTAYPYSDLIELGYPIGQRKQDFEECEKLSRATHVEFIDGELVFIDMDALAWLNMDTWFQLPNDYKIYSENLELIRPNCEHHQQDHHIAPQIEALGNQPRPLDYIVNDMADKHHIQIQIEALGEPGSPVEFVEADKIKAASHLDFDAALNALSAELGVPVAELIGDPCRPAYTQEMVNMKLVPDEGMECIIHFCNASYRSRITYQGDGVGCFIDLNNGKEYTYATSSVTFGTIDTRTDEEKLLNAMTKEMVTDEEFQEVFNMAEEWALKLIASDKFTITLNEQ